MQRLEIFDLDSGGALSFQLSEFLRLLPTELRQKQWYLLELEARGAQGTTANILDIESQVRDGKHGLELTWEALLRIADALDQVIDMTLCGIEAGQDEPTKPLKIGAYADYLLLDVIDSSFWAIESDIESVLALVKSSFRDVRYVPSFIEN